MANSAFGGAALNAVGVPDPQELHGLPPSYEEPAVLAGVRGCLWFYRSLVGERLPRPAAHSASRLSLPKRSRADHNPVPLRLTTLLWKEFLACGAVWCPCSAGCS